MFHQTSIKSSHKTAYTLSKVFRSTATQPTQEVGSIRCVSLRIPISLLEHLKSPTFNHVTSIMSFYFSTLYTIIPHQKLKNRLTSIIRNALISKIGNRRYNYLVLGHAETYFVKERSGSKNKYSEVDIIEMLEFLVDIIFVVLSEKSSSRLSAFQSVRFVPFFSPTSFFIKIKRNSYSLCSQWERNS